MKRNFMAEIDVVIIGGGPAGAILAQRLAIRGYDVSLKLLPPTSVIQREGLSPRAMERLRTIGITHFPIVGDTALPRQATWGSATNNYNYEVLIDRPKFDESLLASAIDAGVKVERRRLIGTVAAKDFNARLLIDARGRKAPRNPEDLRGPRAVALIQDFNGVTSAPSALIKAFAFGWIWAAFPGNGTATVQIMLDGADPRLTAQRPNDIMSDLLKETGFASAQLRSAQKSGPPRARDAGARLTSLPGGSDWLRIGDAAAAIDPLAGHGLYEAIGSARAAEAVCATLLDHPSNHVHALAFHKDRTTNAFLRHARMGRDFYRMETSFHTKPFWQNRINWPDDVPLHAHPQSERPEIKTLPVNSDGYIVLRDVIVTADHPRGVLSIASIPLVPLLAVRNDPIEMLCAQFKSSEAPIRAALAWLDQYDLNGVPAP